MHFDKWIGIITKFFLNYQKHNAGISVNHFFPFIFFSVKFIIANHKIDEKCYFIF